MNRIAVISVHGCPLARLGEKDSGGMNLCVREQAIHLANLGLQVDVFTRRHDPGVLTEEPLAPGARVIHLEAGEAELEKEELYPHLSQFLCQLLRFQQAHSLSYDLIHAHYWLSGWVGYHLKKRWHVPLIATFHTLGEVKRRAHAGERETSLRVETEGRIVKRSDRIVVSSPQERAQLIRLYGAPPHRVEVVPCGVDLELFRPLSRCMARKALGLGDGRIVPIRDAAEEDRGEALP